MRINALVSILFLSACAHKETFQKSPVPKAIPPHPCFTAAAQGDVNFIQKNLEVCKIMKSESGTSPFMLAAARGQDQVLHFMILNGVDVNETDSTFATALNYAVVAHHVSTVGLLILSGADLEAKHSDGITVLMLAIQQSSPEMVRTLTTTRQAINSKAEDGWTALYFAIRREDPRILSLLLRQGACKNTIDSYKQSPLDFAKEIKWEQGVLILEQAPACGKS